MRTTRSSDGTTIAFDRVGEGPALILVGGAFQHRLIDPQTAELAARLASERTVDDLASTDPWRPRGIEVRGRAEALDGDRPLIRIHPERVVPWGLEPGGSARTVKR